MWDCCWSLSKGSLKYAAGVTVFWSTDFGRAQRYSVRKFWESAKVYGNIQTVFGTDIKRGKRLDEKSKDEFDENFWGNLRVKFTDEHFYECFLRKFNSKVHR